MESGKWTSKKFLYTSWIDWATSIYKTLRFNKFGSTVCGCKFVIINQKDLIEFYLLKY